MLTSSATLQAQETCLSLSDQHTLANYKLACDKKTLDLDSYKKAYEELKSRQGSETENLLIVGVIGALSGYLIGRAK